MKAGLYIHLEEFDKVTAKLNPENDLILGFGSDLRVFIQSNHPQYARLCRQFGLYEDPQEVA